MKFRKFGKALLMSAISVGVVFSLSSCVQSYTVGFLYVTGTQTSGSGTGRGIISGFKIDHNTGRLTAVNGLPVASGGANPIRAELLTGSRFLYVLNQGADAGGGSNCTSSAAPCKGSIVQFTVSGNGALIQQQIFYPQGNNSFRMFSDATGSHLYVLDRDAPDSGVGAKNSCSLALGPLVTTCGDITVFTIDPSTGRLSLVANAQVTSATGSPLPYFPVPANAIDFVLTGQYVLTLAATPSGDVVFPYNANVANGQLSISQNTAQPINAHNATAIQAASTGIYVLDNEPATINGTTYQAQILPFTIGSGGALQAQGSGVIPDDPNETNPLFLLIEKGQSSKWAYVANSGDNTNQNNAQSGITGYVIDKATDQFTPMAGSPFASPQGSGAGPRCIVEDPSNQFIYTANFNDSSVTGRSIDHNSGVLRSLPGAANKSYSLPGPATYCVMNGRTS